MRKSAFGILGRKVNTNEGVWPQSYINDSSLKIKDFRSTATHNHTGACSNAQYVVKTKMLIS